MPREYQRWIRCVCRLDAVLVAYHAAMGSWTPRRWRGKRWGAGAWRPVLIDADEDGGGGPQPFEILRITLPAISQLSGDEAAMSGLGHTAHGCYLPVRMAGGSHYWWFTVGGIGLDPGPREGLTGWTGHRVDLSAGNHAQADVMAALADDMEASGLFSSVSTDADEDWAWLDVAGDGLQASASVTHYQAQGGCRTGLTSGYGARGWRGPNGPNTTATTTQRAMQYNPGRMPRRGTVVGAWCQIVAHPSGNQLDVGVSVGPVGTPDGSGTVSRLVTTTGTATGRQVYFAAPENAFQFDLESEETLFISYKADASFTMGANSSGSASVNQIPQDSDFLDGAGASASNPTQPGIWLLSSGPSGSTTDFGTWGTSTSPTNFYCALGLVIQSDCDGDGPEADVVGYYSNFLWEANVGCQLPTVDPSVLGGTAAAAVRVAWPFLLPDIEDIELHAVGMGYGTKADAVPNDRFGIEIGQGGQAINDYIGASQLFHVQTPGGTGTNVWSDYVLPDDVHVPLDPSERMWQMIHRATTGGATSTIRFSSTSFQTNRWRAAYSPAATTDGTNETEDNTPLDAATPMQDPWNRVQGSFDYPGNAGAVRSMIRVRRPAAVLRANP